MIPVDRVELVLRAMTMESFHCASSPAGQLPNLKPLKL